MWQSGGVSDIVSLNGTPVRREPVEHFEQRQVRFRDRLEEPVLLEKFLVLRMPHVGEVRMQDQGEVAVGSHAGGCGERRTVGMG